MRWKSANSFVHSCERLRLEHLKALEHMPDLLRRGEVLRIMGWNHSDTYLRFTKGLRVTPFGHKEKRVPKSVVVSWLTRI